eukprot:CAMPEP_0183457428 /NCGR_PEP_ID=MMETSP0370-20130417/131306_1 /TAXON_ID=268820 /ORGANISM="Peridinium aciculiferum, Strain PAER-2" /LENGTH=90 /DNA_ID=CAMNT_0025649147 /DNA_START=306 /DNA_END=575 /DNA_ORIENTATION=+
MSLVKMKSCPVNDDEQSTHIGSGGHKPSDKVRCEPMCAAEDVERTGVSCQGNIQATCMCESIPAAPQIPDGTPVSAFETWNISEREAQRL